MLKKLITSSRLYVAIYCCYLILCLQCRGFYNFLFTRLWVQQIFPFFQNWKKKCKSKKCFKNHEKYFSLYQKSKEIGLKNRKTLIIVTSSQLREATYCCYFMGILCSQWTWSHSFLFTKNRLWVKRIFSFFQNWKKYLKARRYQIREEIL